MADKINCLPDDVLYEILTYLTTKEAFATTLLSKRWNHLWRSLPTLNFDDSPSKFDRRFIQMVDTLVLSRDPHQTIRKFRFRCDTLLCNSTKLNNWVQAVLKHKVQHFELELPCFPNIIFHLPSGVLNCKTFVVLNLKCVFVKDFPSVDFPLLKVLHLVRVDFLEHRHLAELLAASSNLEDLKAVDLGFRNYEIEGCFKILPKLVMAHIVKACIPFMVVSNVKFLHINGAMNTRPFREFGGQIIVFPNLIQIELGHWYYSRSNDCLELLEHIKFGPDLASKIYGECCTFAGHDKRLCRIPMLFKLFSANFKL